jgi:HK97 gp10 family phage protein
VIKVSTIGLDDLTERIRKASSIVRDDIARELADAAADYEARVIKDVPINDGALKRSVHKAKIGENQWEVYVGSSYAPFLEFGTKGKYQPIPGYEDVAAQFKGKGKGTFKQLLEAIEKWVKKNGIKKVGEEKAKSVRNKKGKVKRKAGSYSATAFWIALSIVKNGIKPHPFFYKQVNPVGEKLRNNIMRLLNKVA